MIAAALAVLGFLAAPAARAQETQILSPSDAVVTGFSGYQPNGALLVPGMNPLDQSFINPDVASAKINLPARAAHLLEWPEGTDALPAWHGRQVAAQLQGKTEGQPVLKEELGRGSATENVKAGSSLPAFTFSSIFAGHQRISEPLRRRSMNCA